ncbi:hypothetical protein [Paenibacillus thermotolerans]|uniref:hypothetical protein n=1 Tax=Paenibacillus thermotolerans TaxID=3027807 RepID=UPI00236810B1|nr:MULTISPECIES: hypothetical protein [unclassified Paenibacillus]
MNKEIEDQTAFETAGIPTPVNQQDIASTDMISGAVAEIIDNVTERVTGRTVKSPSSAKKRK